MAERTKTGLSIRSPRLSAPSKAATKSYCRLALIFWFLAAAGCMTPQEPKATRLEDNTVQIELQTAELWVSLEAVLSAGQTPTLVEDPGWREYILAIKNLSQWPLTVKTVKLLNADGRYVDSASSYGQIIAPPDPGEQVAGHVARSATGIAVGQVIPFGGLITSTIFSAASAFGTGTKTTAKRAFYLRVLKKVELAPGGKVSGSAFLPDIPNARQLVVEYQTQDREKAQVEIPLPGGDF